MENYICIEDSNVPTKEDHYLKRFIREAVDIGDILIRETVSKEQRK